MRILTHEISQRPLGISKSKKNVLREIKRKAKKLKDKPHTDFVANPKELRRKDYVRRYTGATGKEYAPTFPEFHADSPKIKGLSTKNKKLTTITVFLRNLYVLMCFVWFKEKCIFEVFYV